MYQSSERESRLRKRGDQLPASSTTSVANGRLGSVVLIFRQNIRGDWSVNSLISTLPFQLGFVPYLNEYNSINIKAGLNLHSMVHFILMIRPIVQTKANYIGPWHKSAFKFTVI